MNKAAGFTLIELMIVVAIVAILSAVAVNSYQESTAKGRRAEAMAALMEGAQQLERYYSVNGRYTSSAGGSTLPTGVFPTKVPANSATPYYTIAVDGTPSETTFKLRATRASIMSTDKCGDFQIDQANAHTLATGTNTYSLEQCWRR